MSVGSLMADAMAVLAPAQAAQVTDKPHRRWWTPRHHQQKTRCTPSNFEVNAFFIRHIPTSQMFAHSWRCPMTSMSVSCSCAVVLNGPTTEEHVDNIM